MVIDGAMGEGGGQVLRTALALSMVTGEPFRIERIRQRRAKPGLLRQHLTAVLAAEKISAARTAGAALGSTELAFMPGSVTPGEHGFAIGTAGSTTLVIQTVLPALLTAAAPSRLTLEGGTHNPAAPPWDFLVESFLPLLERMGPRFDPRLERPGFAPAGGGRLTLHVTPAPRLSRLDLTAGPEIAAEGLVLLANLPRHIAERERDTLLARIGWAPEQVRIRHPLEALGPGNAVILLSKAAGLTSVFTSFGKAGVPAEAVAEAAVGEYRAFRAAGVAVEPHLADQLILPLALAGGGSFTTLPLSGHAATQLELVPRFLDVPLRAREAGDGVVVEIG